MINVSELVVDPEFSQAFTIVRSTGQFSLGGWQNESTTIPALGVIVPAGSQDLDQVPEGDRVTGAMAIYTQTPLYRTHATPTPGLSDLIVWRGEEYRIAHVFPYQDFGFYKAVAVRLLGE
jgi:hypothetical protein